MENDKPQEEQKRKVSITIDPDRPADSILQDKEKGLNCLIIVVPLSMPKTMVYGYLWQVLQSVTNMFAAAELKAASRPSILRSTMNDAAALGRRLGGI